MVNQTQVDGGEKMPNNQQQQAQPQAAASSGWGNAYGTTPNGPTGSTAVNGIGAVGPDPNATWGSFIANPSSFAPQSINNFGGLTQMNPSGYNASNQQYLNSPQAYQSAFVGMDPNVAYQSYNQTANMLNQSMQPQFQQQQQALNGDMASRGIFNSSAADYNMQNLVSQQNATMSGADSNLLANAQNQFGNLYSTGYTGSIGQNQFNTSAQNAASQAGYQGLLGQMSANQSMQNQAAQYNASAQNAAGQFNSQNANAAAGQEQQQYNQWLQSLQQEQFGLGNASLESYLSSFGDTSAAGILGQAGTSAAGAYNNAFNSQNNNNNLWSQVLGQGLGAAGTVFAGKK